ncbi:L-aspartate oxidase [Allonocardiopsis opalescens]|nr:L-aspartate oxidase [Allonocardiopsis opalescens]
MSAAAALPRLRADRPGWTVHTDVLVVGSGIAGLATALRLRELAPGLRLLLVTKDVLDNGSTRWAQGGIAAALHPLDTPLAHLADTLAAGSHFNDPDAVRALVTEGPAAVRWLIERGTGFDRDRAGGIALTREGGHRADRIAHAGGDATGAEIERALIDAVRADPGIEVIKHALALDALLAADGSAAGMTLHVMGEGRPDGVGAVRARAVVLATGGMGQIYAATTNPDVSTGDGLALALRAGAAVRDLEFVQFHPTVLWLGPDARGQQPLVSEAVRGEGAFLVDARGRRFMAGAHELADLAPRDAVAKAISRAMRDTGTDHVYLDARHFGAAKWEARFPTILATCRAHGIDPVTQLIPVTPAAHYASGGVHTDLRGRTTVPGLYAVGEVACTGVHGANRLASNSLLEGVVFAHRIAADLAAGLPDAAEPAPDPRTPVLADPGTVPELRAAMSARAGVVRRGPDLQAALDTLDDLAARPAPAPGLDAWQATNLLQVARMVALAALARPAGAGTHWREDGPTGPVEAARAEFRLSPDGPRPVPLHGGQSGALLAELAAAGIPWSRPHGRPALGDLVAAALGEDLDGGPERIDATSAATVPADQLATAHVVARRAGVLAGLPVAEAVFHQVARGAVLTERHTADGERVKAGQVLMTVRGRTRDLLTAERTALNFLTRMSGVATLTRRWADAIDGTGARLRDSRKTIPGLRALDKYAVRCGGGVNHRYSLADAALIKDNHVVAAGGVAEAVRAVRAAHPGLPLEVEVDRIDQIEPALAAGAEEILLDNFTVPRLAEAVALVAGRARLEASGGLDLASARDVAATGVDYLAVGALTHSAPALDIALDLLPAGHPGPDGTGRAET